MSAEAKHVSPTKRQPVADCRALARLAVPIRPRWTKTHQASKLATACRVLNTVCCEQGFVIVLAARGANLTVGDYTAKWIPEAWRRLSFLMRADGR